MTTMDGYDRARSIAEGGFAQVLGARCLEVADDRVVVRMPWHERLGIERIHGGAISALVDVAATAAFWARGGLGPESRGATVGFSISFTRLSARTDLVATATVRKRGGSICFGEVSVANVAGEEVAFATVTYKLQV